MRALNMKGTDMTGCRYLQAVLWCAIILHPRVAPAEIVKKTENGFTIRHELILADSPEAVYDATTGDISRWWDHSFTEKPAKLWIEARPGGRFYELFDDSGSGALHGIVTWAERGKRLRLVGSLGFSGMPVQFFWTYDYEPDKAGTKLTLTCHATGMLEPSWSKAVDSVWKHFLVDRLKPYIAEGKHKKKPGDKKP